jgi:hypothetical protein
MMGRAVTLNCLVSGTGDWEGVVWVLSREEEMYPVRCEVLVYEPLARARVGELG